METITIHIRPINWTQGDVTGVYLRLSGEKPAVCIDWGDGAVETYYGTEINQAHLYPKDESLSFVVTVTILSGRIDYVDPTGGEVEYELIDFSKAPSIREISVDRTERVIFDNPNLEKMEMRINLGNHYDLSRCPNLRELVFQCESDCESVDLSHCHKLEWLSSWGYWSPKLREITIADDAPLRYVEIDGHNLQPSCLEAIHRVVDRNGGEIVGEFEDENNDEEEKDILL